MKLFLKTDVITEYTGIKGVKDDRNQKKMHAGKFGLELMHKTTKVMQVKGAGKTCRTKLEI